MRPIDVYFFGDSILFGQDMSVEKTWVVRLGAEFENLRIQNPSINGNTTRQGLERMPHDVQQHHVDILVLGFGMNDCNYWETDNGVPRVSPNAFKANLEEMIERARVNGTKEIVLHTNHSSPKKKKMYGHDFTYHDSNARYNEIIRQVAREDERLIFLDVERLIDTYIIDNSLEEGAHVMSDQVHLNELGHELYFRYMKDMLQIAVERVEKCLM